VARDESRPCTAKPFRKRVKGIPYIITAAHTGILSLRYGRKVDVRLPSHDSCYIVRCYLIYYFMCCCVGAQSLQFSRTNSRRTSVAAAVYYIIGIYTIYSAYTDYTRHDPAPDVPDCEIKTGEKISQTPPERRVVAYARRGEIRGFPLRISATTRCDFSYSPRGALNRMRVTSCTRNNGLASPTIYYIIRATIRFTC